MKKKPLLVFYFAMILPPPTKQEKISKGGLMRFRDPIDICPTLKEFLFNAYKVEKFPKYSNVSIYERFF
jgi:hypothetical protein